MAGVTSEPVPVDLADALAQLREAKETLRAIGAGEVDAFLISDGGLGHRVFTLATADRPYRMFVEHMRDGAATVAADGLILYANDRLAELVGRPKESIVGTALSLYIAGESPESWFEFGGADRAGASLELELIAAAGRTVTVLVGASPIDVDGEQLTCLTFTDLTEERLKDVEIARLHLAEMSAGVRLTAVVEALQEGVLVQDTAGRVLQANRMAATILDVAVDELVTDPPSPLSWREMVSARTPMPSEETPGRQALARGLPVMGVTVAIERRDELAWLEISAVPVVLPGEPEVPVVVSSFRDVTARIAADDSIRFQAQLLDSAGQAIIAVDGLGIVLYWNKHAEHMYGWTALEAVGRSVVELILPDETLALGQVIVDTMQSGATWSSDHWVRHRDGTLFPIFATSTPTLDDDGNLLAMITVATDITDRKRAEEQARRLSAIVESSTDAIIGMTLDRVITTWNPGATSLFGYEAQEALGQSLDMLAPTGASDFPLPGRDAAPGTSFRDVETRCRTKNGVLVQIALSISPIRNEQGEPVGLSSIARDITERVALEQIAESSRQQLLAAQHAAELEAIGREEATRANNAKSEFLSRMSHELRTPLNAVLGFGQVLLMEELTADQRESVGFIKRAGEHLLDLINDVLDISRIEAGALKLSREPVNLSEVIDSALSLMRPQAAQRNVSVPAESCVPHDLYVHSDRQRLLQILLNLLSNAVKYNRPNGSIELRCQAVGDSVAIAVTDTGMGVASANLSKLFTPFERLGAEGTDIEGTGIGLALSRSLTEQMGGTLTAFSTEGTGSTFTVTLPAALPLDATALLEPIPAATPRCTSSKLLTVLAIEDNVVNIRLLERLAEKDGNIVLLTAIQGRLGLELAAQHHPDLILLDLHLPDLHGEVVLDELRSDPVTASIPVVVCSGDASPSQRRACLNRGATAYFSKPFLLTDLFEVFEQVRRGESPEVVADQVATEP
jgi:PAS domain S-box-containing protein